MAAAGEFSGVSGAQRRFDLSASAALAPLLDHYQAKVTGAEICKGGPLNLTSTDDAVLLVEPDDRYEGSPSRASCRRRHGASFSPPYPVVAPLG
ncbi:hypothetical protein ACFYPX_21025 [Micromonospora zamorensis]|uniref:hypothetical protein n=1 Tax=Micromonospora zamorensis TaxID=709883 RepID=UPI00369A68A7